jgi:hypothetical protein
MKIIIIIIMIIMIITIIITIIILLLIIITIIITIIIILFPAAVATISFTSVGYLDDNTGHAEGTVQFG